jgi:50S ribosomal subunit-associated GTPase HflX
MPMGTVTKGSSAKKMEDKDEEIIPVSTVAGSVATGQGLSQLATALMNALTLDFKGMDCFFPYADDAGSLVSYIQSHGTVNYMQHRENGVFVSCSVPSHAATTVQKYQIRAV